MENDNGINAFSVSTNCLICFSTFTKPLDIKVETCEIEGDLEADSFSNNIITFLIKTLLEIPQCELIEDYQAISNRVLSNICEQCTQLIIQSKQIYSEIVHLTKKFRQVQKHFVNNFSKRDTHKTQHSRDNLFNSFLQVLVDSKQNGFNGFGYPFVVNGDNIFNKLSLPDLSQDNFLQDGYPPVSCEDATGTDDGDNDVDYKIEAEAQDDSDSDFKPVSPPKRVKGPHKSNVPNRKVKTPTKQNQPEVDKKTKFDRLHPEYPKLLPDPFTNKFHCLEPNCSKSFPRKDGLEGHIMAHHLKDKLFKCTWLECGKSFLKSGDLQNHLDKHEGKPRWKCVENPETCDKAFYYPGDLVRHKQIYHETEKSWICEICGKGFSCRQTLGTHKLRRHRTNQPKEKKENLDSVKFICEDCGKEFTLKKNLQAHVDLVHRKFEGKFGCSFEGCLERFEWKFHLKSHLWRRHKFSMEGYQEKIRKERRTEETQCKVKGCRKPFMSEESLRRHMERKHGGDKEEVETDGEFKCKWCGKGFHLKGKLKRHEETHANLDSKPYKCELCGKGFSIMQYLKNHLKSGVHNK